MIDFCNVELETSFSLKYSEFDELRPVFDEFYRKTGLVIDEYGDTRLIIDNLFLIKDIAIDYTKKEINKETRVLIQSFIKNLEMITKGGYHFLFQVIRNKFITSGSTSLKGRLATKH